ncbi:MAG TPA: DUF6114 domain-containing protein [Streptosporangiaceae bacterium]
MTTPPEPGCAAAPRLTLPGFPADRAGLADSGDLADPAGQAGLAQLADPDHAPRRVSQRRPVPPVRAWRVFREWRRRRPFWGGLFILLAGTEMFLTEIAPLHVVVHLGVEGLAGEAVPVLLAVCGLLLIFAPEQRLFYSIVAMLLTVASWITSNLGGFILGLILGLLGCALAFAWTPLPGPAPEQPAADES